MPVLSTFDKPVSDAIKVSKQISMKKNIVFPEKSIETTIITSEFDNENGQVSSSTRIWPQYGYFNQQPISFNMKKSNYPEKSIIYTNQAYLTVKINKKMYYVDYFLTGQIIEAIGPPENITNHVCKNREVRFYRPHHDTSTGEFLGLYETTGYLVVRGDDDKHFLNYGFCEENSKILYSCNICRIPNSFGGMLFNRHHLLVETNQLLTNRFFKPLLFFIFDY